MAWKLFRFTRINAQKASLPALAEGALLLGRDDLNSSLRQFFYHDGTVWRAVVDDGQIDIDTALALNSDKRLASQKAVKAYIDARMSAGMIAMHAGSTAPTGFLICDGSALSRTVYSVLFGTIGTTYGVGDGSTTFNLPDLREAAPVGIGTRAAGVSAHDAFTLGQFKDDQKETHTHTISSAQGNHGHSISDPGHSHVINAAAGATPGPNGQSNGANNAASFSTNASGTGISIVAATLPAMTADGTGSGRVGTVTRGKRLGLNFIIKY